MPSWTLFLNVENELRRWLYARSEWKQIGQEVAMTKARCPRDWGLGGG